jgi:holo-[acyl-carrier protein] synthase
MNRIGIDVVPVGRIRTSLERRKDVFLAKMLSPREAEYCAGPRMVERVAGRVAAKEAVMKVIGQGWPVVGWTDIEVLPGPTGRPCVSLTGRALEHAQAIGLGDIDVSITHDGDLAIAAALGSLRGK